ncbi:MAG: hypothetical protein ACYTFG_14950 [Planctomycetota bacterium]|jgi:hypothetical protein
MDEEMRMTRGGRLVPLLLILLLLALFGNLGLYLRGETQTEAVRAALMGELWKWRDERDVEEARMKAEIESQAQAYAKVTDDFRVECDALRQKLKKGGKDLSGLTELVGFGMEFEKKDMPFGAVLHNIRKNLIVVHDEADIEWDSKTLSCEYTIRSLERELGLERRRSAGRARDLHVTKQLADDLEKRVLELTQENLALRLGPDGK